MKASADGRIGSESNLGNVSIVESHSSQVELAGDDEVADKDAGDNLTVRQSQCNHATNGISTKRSCEEERVFTCSLAAWFQRSPNR